MIGTLYPRNRIASILLKSGLPDCYRIMPARHAANPLGTVPADSRFCSRTDGYTVLYASPDFATALIETIVRDRFTHRRDRQVALREITDRVWACIATHPQTELTLLDLRGDGCTRIGAPTDTVRARNHAAGRAFAKTIHSAHPDIDGLVYVSRLTDKEVYAVFDRGITKLDHTGTGMLANHPDLPDILERHGIELVR
ncbi:MAG: RES family NAD+ phosphorylase [Rhodospirillaceae bacterium]|nr:RES family NAD+ phosphorylase [Rhodospirillaceae bacterium]